MNPTAIKNNSEDTAYLCADCTHFTDEDMYGAGFCEVLNSAYCYCDSLPCGHFELKTTEEDNL